MVVKSEENEKKSKTYIGIDYGNTNMGLAIGKNGLTSPMSVISGKNHQVAIHEITRLAYENKIDGFVMGLPLTGKGMDTPKAREVRRFSKMLKIISKKPVYFQDEHATTLGAAEEALHQGIPTKRRSIKDHLAAELILKRFFDET